MAKRLIVCISGSGTNLQAILDAIADGRLSAELVLVVSNRRGAYGLERAQRAGVPTLYFPLQSYIKAGGSRESYDEALALRLREYEPDLIVLAGWMHVFSAAFLRHFSNQVVNLHPALPGTFPGLHAIERALDAYRRDEIAYSGCMVHYVIPEVDAGAVIAEAIVRFDPNDTLETFEARMHTTEHVLIVEALRQLCAETQLDRPS